MSNPVSEFWYEAGNRIGNYHQSFYVWTKDLTKVAGLRLIAVVSNKTDADQIVKALNFYSQKEAWRLQ